MHLKVDAGGFTQMIICASAAVLQNKQLINDLNVFPVPDGDTGTNMSLTIGCAVKELRAEHPDSVGRAAEITANALLRGARGNSGVILSLLFRGFSKALRGHADMDGADFANALTEGVDAAYKAVMKPAEGTILTVSRVSAAAARAAGEENPDLENVMAAAIKAAEAALKETTEQNPVLKKAGVIDAGGRGFVAILEGMFAALKGATEADFGGLDADTAGAATFGNFSDEDITYTYCTEFIVEHKGKQDPAPLAALLESRGDSVVLVDEDGIIKVHVHTDDPGLIIQQALSYGQLLTVKVENMRQQHTGLIEKEHAQTCGAVPAEKPFGFVAVCAGKGLADIFRDLGVDGIINGGQTMNPSTQDILREIEKTPAQTVFVLPNNKNVIMAAQQCEPLCPGRRIIVLPTNSVPEGISAMLAFDPDVDADANGEAMREAISRVTTAQITYAARDSEYDGQTIRQGEYMSLIDGRLSMNNSDLRDIVRNIADEINARNCEFLSIFYGDDVTEAEAAEVEILFQGFCPDAEINLVWGGQPVYYYIISGE